MIKNVGYCMKHCEDDNQLRCWTDLYATAVLAVDFRPWQAKQSVQSAQL